MRIRNVKHKGLRRLIESDDRAGLPGAVAEKLVNIIGFLEAMQDEDETARRADLESPSTDRRPQRDLGASCHQNWRITFLIDRQDIEIIDLDYEDYH